ncbi:MAG: WD40 repeat domain-containing protein [Planctomycetes bacterium]|nr:WD40 repeat domain-containing protein [Planctomycetota bacterium]
MLEVALLLSVFAVKTADLPPGAVLRLGDDRWRAAGEVRDLRFSTDGVTLSGWVGHADGSVRPASWNVAGGFPCANVLLRSPSEWIAEETPSVRLGGNRVLTAGPGNAGRVWDATTARQLAQLTGHIGRVTAVAKSPDGKRLATGSADGLVRLWDGETFRPISEPQGHIAPVRTVRVSADGKRAVTLSDDGTARVWNLATGAELRAFAVAGSVEFTPDGLGLIALTVEGEATVRDILTGAEMVPSQPPKPPSFTVADWLAHHGVPMAISPAGRMVAVACTDGTVVLDEMATRGGRRQIRGHGSRCVAVAFTPDGTRLLTAGADHTVLVWDVRPQAMPLPMEVRRETNAAKLWATMCVGKADASYLAMARLALEPAAAVATARMRMKPATAPDGDTTPRLANGRAIELLESLRTAEARAFLKELAGGDGSAWRTQEAKRALERLGK